MAITKKEIVKMLLNDKEVETDDPEYLIDMLVKQPVAVDIDKEIDENSKFGDRLADVLTKIAGSWIFIMSFFLMMLVWIILNISFLVNKFDPYPFILLNLVLSCVASVQAPIIMMSQNRQAEKDRLRGHNDYKADLKSELILEDLHEKITQVLKTEREILRKLNNEEDEEN